MEEILHHVGCLKPYTYGINHPSTGAGVLSWVWVEGEDLGARACRIHLEMTQGLHSTRPLRHRNIYILAIGQGIVDTHGSPTKNRCLWSLWLPAVLVGKPMELHCVYHHITSGWWFQPSWKIWFRQWEGWHHMTSHIWNGKSNSCSKPTRHHIVNLIMIPSGYLTVRHGIDGP